MHRKYVAIKGTEWQTNYFIFHIHVGKYLIFHTQAGKFFPILHMQMSYIKDQSFGKQISN